VTTLNANEERFVEALRALPPDAADQVITWTTRLRELAGSRSVEWSDTWTEEDLQDARRASSIQVGHREHHVTTDYGYVHRDLITVACVGVVVIGFIVGMSFVL